MNIVALRYAIAAVVVVVVSALLGLLLGKGGRQKLEGAVSWLLRVSFLDFVNMVIFLKPWKPYLEQTAVVLWVIMVYAVGSYMITEMPALTEIEPVFIPVIGYVYFVSILMIMRAVLRLFPKND